MGLSLGVTSMRMRLTTFLFCLALISPVIAVAEPPYWQPGASYLGFQAGWGKGFSGHGDTRQVEYIAVFPHLGFDISGMVGTGRWYGGNLDLLFEAEYFSSLEPQTGDSAGGAILLRHNFRPWPRLSPYLEIGFGVGYLDFDLRDQADGLIFYPQFGAGLNYAISRRLNLNAGWRYHHMSNAGREQPNSGIDANVFLLGFSYTWN